MKKLQPQKGPVLASIARIIAGRAKDRDEHHSTRGFDVCLDLGGINRLHFVK